MVEEKSCSSIEDVQIVCAPGNAGGYLYGISIRINTTYRKQINQNMEINNFNHIGPEAVVENLMIHSVSPSARKRVQELYTCNPYDINIKLDEESKNRVAEIVNTYLKAIGLRLVFAKVPKYRYIEPISPFIFDHNPVVQPFEFVPKDVKDKEKWIKEVRKFEEEKKNNPNTIQPFVFQGIDLKRRAKINENNKIALETRHMNPREKYEYFKKREEAE